MVVEAYYSMLNALFSPVLSLNFALAELILACMVVFMTTLLSRFMVDQNKAKEIKKQISEFQKRMKEVKDNKEETEKVGTEMLKLTNHQMRSNMKPMLVIMIVAFAFLPWIGNVFSDSVISLPFSLPFLGNDFGWLAWYVTLSIPFSFIFRRALGVVS